MTYQMASAVPVILTVLGILTVLITGEIYRELHTFHVTRYSVESGKFSSGEKKLRILFLSDLHNREYGDNNERLYQAVCGESPDLILIGGDMLIGKPEVSWEPAFQFIKRLPGICPVYYANGNHEQRMKEEPSCYDNAYREYRARLEKAGIVFLENESGQVRIGNCVLNIRGLELPLDTYRKMKRSPVTVEDVDRLLGENPGNGMTAPSCFSVLLAHNPAYMDAYKKSGADLILSGHLHGGIVRIPGIGGVISPQMFFFPRYSGEMSKEGEQTVIVSRGLGSHSINLRLFNTPELISITLCPAGETDKGAGKKSL